jgi:hypothetical protein
MFIFFTFLEFITVKNVGRYPPSTNCDNIDALFPDNVGYETYA